MIVELLLAGVASIADEQPVTGQPVSSPTETPDRLPDVRQPEQEDVPAGDADATANNGDRPATKKKKTVVETPFPKPSMLGNTPAVGPGIAGIGAKEKEKDLQFRVVPVPIINPTIGSGMAVAVLATFGKEGRRSTLAVAGGYARNGSWLVGAGGGLHLFHDNVRVSWSAGVGELNLKYYGTGSDSILADNPINFSGKGWAAQVRPEIKVFDNVYAGVAARYVDAKIITKLPIDVLPELEVPFKILSLGPIFEFDTRDSGGWPTSGVKISGEYLFSRETAGVFRRDVVDRFKTFNLVGTAYFQLRENLVLATLTRAAGASDDTPFFLKPSLSFRGFSSGEQLDGAALEAQAEVRWMLNRKLGAVVFSGIGSTGKSLSSLGKPSTGTGAGIRYRISQVDKTNVGFDFAHSSRGNWSVYFTVGEAF